MKVLLLAILLSLGCAKKAAPLPMVHRGAYVYQEIEKDVFVIIARNEQAFKEALREIQCEVCSIEPNGTSFVVRKLK